MTHTPTPWKISETASRAILGKANGCGWMQICTMMNTQSEHYEANTRFIVTACNSHDQLVKALKDVMTADTQGEVISQTVRDHAYAAIAAAEGDKP